MKATSTWWWDFKLEVFDFLGVNEESPNEKRHYNRKVP